MKRIAIVSCDKWKGIIREDVLLTQELINNGYLAEIISWQDENVSYDEFDALILRSVWGYQNEYLKFKQWLLSLKEKNIKIFNDVDILINNIRKDKQFEILDKYGIAHINTTFTKNLFEIKFLFEANDNKIKVIKPVVSGSGDNTYKITSGMGSVHIDEIVEKFKNIISVEDNGAMIQPYIEEVGNGEYACIFIGGINTHNMLRYPGVFSEKRTPMYLEEIPIEVLELAYKVANIPEFSNHLYMRVDIVHSNNEAYVMEVELAEPDLLIKYITDVNKQKEVVDTFVKKIGRMI